MLNPTKFESSSSYCFAVYYLKQIQMAEKFEGVL